MEPTVLTVITQAIAEKQWYALAGFVITVIIAIWRSIQPKVWDKIPSQFKPVPALILSALTAFLAAYQNGETWYVATSMAVYTLLTAWPISLGTADIVIRILLSPKSVVTEETKEDKEDVTEEATED